MQAFWGPKRWEAVHESGLFSFYFHYLSPNNIVCRDGIVGWYGSRHEHITIEEKEEDEEKKKWGGRDPEFMSPWVTQ